MDSPERTQITSPSPVVQDSPLYSFLSTLSPIKPVKSRNAAQAFTEYNFPSPVFTSPRFNQQRGTGFLKGSQCALLSKGKHSIGEEDSRVADCSLASEQSITKSIGSGGTSCSTKECSKDSEQDIPRSSSGTVEEYLAETVAVGKNVAGTATSTDVLVNQAHDVSHGCISSKENSVNLANDPEAKDTGTEAVASHTLLGTAEEDLLGSVELDLVTYPVSGEQCQPRLVSDVGDEQLAVVSNQMEQTSVEADADRPDCSVSLDHHGLQNGEVSQHSAIECTRQLPCESLQMTQAHNGRDEIRGVTCDGSVESSIFYDSEEGNQLQRGTLRRCLQFEAAQPQGNTFGDTLSSWNAPNVLNSRSPASSTDLEISDLSHLKRRSTSSSRSRRITSRVTITTVTTLETHEVGRSVQNSVISSAKVPMPSGIGLHLNSIVNTPVSSKFIAKACSSSHSGKALSITEQDLHENSDSLSLPITTENLSDTLDNNQQGNLATVRESSATFQSSHKMSLMNEILNFEQENEHHMTPCDSRTASENSIRFEEFSEPPTKKRRKKTPNSIDNSEGCRRCSCKKTKCLKLYCECFAAGVYCSEPCSCVGCFNKPEYEETVLATRRKIESRNPLAFAPKILGTFKEIGNQVTPASGRHKRGCNCKKSKCLKKYCECYQAGVGCSDGCRCEGCQNVFGLKEGYDESREMLYRKFDVEKWEDSAGDKLEIANGNDMLQLELPNPDNLSPLTPMFQSSNHGKDMAKSRIQASRYDPSPESEWQLKTDKETSDVITCDLELECSVAGRVDPILQRHDEPADFCDLTPLPNIISRAKASSSASNTTGSAKASQGRFNLGSVSLSSLAPHRWRGSPVTPLPRLGVNKFPQEPDSDNSMLCQIQEDDTPEILKDSRTPIKAVKASSPNQKRVSPPQNNSPEPRLTCSPSLKSGRKFVLQSISAFPPLTPYSDPKGGRIDK